MENKKDGIKRVDDKVLENVSGGVTREDFYTGDWHSNYESVEGKPLFREGQTVYLVYNNDTWWCAGKCVVLGVSATRNKGVINKEYSYTLKRIDGPLYDQVFEEVYEHAICKSVGEIDPHWGKISKY